MEKQNRDFGHSSLPEETFALLASLNDYTIEHDVLTWLNQEASILLHHDAITGTNTEKTKKDYFKRIKNIRASLDGVHWTLFEDLFAIKTSSNEGHEVRILTLFNPTLYTKNEVYNITDNCSKVRGMEQFQSGQLEPLKVEYVKLEGECVFFFQVEVKPMSMVKLVIHEW